MIGKTLAHYKITEKIGAGGMGEVYRASDSKLGRDVALKILPDTFAKDPERLARFQREAQVLAQLNHANIAAIYGLEKKGDSAALVLELVEGPTLADRIRSGAIPASESLQIASQIAAAIESAHELGIIHRDLKPGNVKLTSEGDVKVLDFGLAKALEPPTDISSGATLDSPTVSPVLTSPVITGALTGANVILGTAAYMSPEQARGKPVDKRCDIWSFGVVLFEMLTGRPLFAGETISDTLASVLKTDPDWDQLPANLSPRIHRLLRRCLERDPRKRLRDIGDARIALQEVMSGDHEDLEPTAAAPAERKHRVLIAAVAAVVGAIVGFVVQGTLQPDAPEAPVTRFRIPVSDLWTAREKSVAISPDGRRIVYHTEGKLWVRDLDVPDPRPLEGTEGGREPFWSPDGEWIGYGDRGKLYKIRPSGNVPQTLCELKSGFGTGSGGAWTPDGRIAFTTATGPLWTVSAQGGDPDTLLAPETGVDRDYHDVSALPDGRGYLVVVHRDGGTYDRIDLLAGNERKTLVFMDGERLDSPAWSPSGHVIFARMSSNPGIWAVPFSLSSLEATGDPFLVVPDGTLPSVSRDGTLVLATDIHQEKSQLVWVDRSGQPQGDIGQPQDHETRFALSPDGETLLLEVNRGDEDDLFVADLARQTQTRLTFADQQEASAIWSRDGTRVYYSVSGSWPDMRTWMIEADGSGEPVEVLAGASPALSPNGEFMAYSKADENNSSDWDLYHVRVNEGGFPEGEATKFVDTASAALYPAFSPDGRYVAYFSNENDPTEIFLRRFPSGSGKWQVSSGGGYWPKWKEDGTELYYVSGNEIFAVPVELDPVVRLGTPELLFTRPDFLGTMAFGWPDGYDVTPDGERFIIAVRPEGERTPVTEQGFVVVQNWASEIAERE